MNKRLLAAGGAVLVAATAVAIYVYPLIFPSAPAVIDRLCEYVRGQRMNCIATIAADSFVHPGSIVDYRPSETPARDVLSLPVSDITGDSCLVPGAPAVREATRAKADVSIPNMVYETNGSLAAGATVELPQLSGASIKAGPSWSNVQKVDVSVDQAWVSQMDELLALSAVRSCSFKKICVDRIKAKQYRVVASSLVAKGLSYKFYDKSGAVISLDAAAKDGLFEASVNAGSNIQQSTDATLKAADPRVVGVRLLPLDVFDDQPVCEDTIVFAADGNATVTIGGGGGRGQIGARPPVRKPLNEVAQIEAIGTEQSECREDFERKRSSAKAFASVTASGDGKMTLKYELAAGGGHYVTVAGCFAGNVIGKTGHDNNATASADLMGTLLVTVRSEGAPILRVDWSKMPSSGAEIRIVDWNNEALRDAKTEEVVGPIATSGNGGVDVRTRGPGVYRVEARVQLGSSVGGNVDSAVADEAEVSVGIVN
jgi:hypothetical protein